MKPIPLRPKLLPVKQSYYSTHAQPLPSPIQEICLKNHFHPRRFDFGSAAQETALRKLKICYVSSVNKYYVKLFFRI